MQCSYYLWMIHQRRSKKKPTTNFSQNLCSESTLTMLKMCAHLIFFFLFLFQKHLEICKKLPVECPDGCGSIVVREKVEDVIKIDTNCPQILMSTRAIKSPIYDHREQKQKSQKTILWKYY